MNIYDKRVAALQEQMKIDGLRAYVIPSTDPHLSEAAAERFTAERDYFCSFDGQDGTLLVTRDSCYLYTDGRYWSEAEKELEESNCKLVKDGKPGVDSIYDFVKKNNLYPLGLDASCISLGDLRKFYIDKDHEIRQITYRKSVKDLPELPKDKIWKVDDKYLATTLRDRVNDLMDKVVDAGAKAIIVSKLDDVAYILGYRGSDVPYTPVFYAYLYIGEDRIVHLFIDQDKLPQSFNANAGNVIVHPYDGWKEFLLSNIYVETVVDPNETNAYICCKLKKPIYKTSVVGEMKSVKDEVAIANTKEVQMLEGVAILKMMKYIEDNKDSGELTELDVADFIEEARCQNDRCLGNSFDSIVAVDTNAAMMHYAPNEDTNQIVSSGNRLVLVDTGGQYLGGTTDTTRTIILNEDVSPEIKHDYTMVLKAQIALQQTVFIKGCSGVSLDVKARDIMWQNGMDYKCGSGHGVGYMGCVHEGPLSLRYKPRNENDVEATLQPGNVITIEPGVYKDGKYGIRLENMLLVVPAIETNDGVFYKFENITYVPYDVRAIDVSLLTNSEIEWLNDYHKEVFSKLNPLCSKDYELSSYLYKLTAKISKDND